MPRGPGEGGAEGKAGEKHTDSEAIAKVNVYPLRSFLQDGVLLKFGVSNPRTEQ